MLRTAGRPCVVLGEDDEQVPTAAGEASWARRGEEGRCAPWGDRAFLEGAPCPVCVTRQGRAMHQSRLLGPWPSFAMSCVTLSKLSGLSDLRLLFSYNRESDRTDQGSRPDAVGGSGTTLIIMQ